MTAQTETPAPSAPEGERADIAFEETRGMDPAALLAAFHPWPGSPPPRLRRDHLCVAGCRGELRAGGARIPVEATDRIYPWPLP